MTQSQDQRYGHVEEYRLWLKSDKLERKAVDLSVLSYVQRYDIREKCRGDMARVRAALCKLGQILDDDDFQADLDPLTAEFTQQCPHTERPPRHKGLQITSWIALSPQLRDALIRDGFQCVSDADAVPQIYLGVGVLETYRDLVTHPDVVATSKAAEGIVRGRQITGERERPGPASEHRGSPAATIPSEGSAPVPAGVKAADKRDPVADEAVPGPRVRAAAKRSPDPAYVRAPDVAMYHLMETTAGGEFLAAIVAREGEINFDDICRHVRGSYALSRIAGATKEKITARLKDLSTGDDAAISLDDQGRYRRRSPGAEPTLIVEPADHHGGAREAAVSAGAEPIVLRGPKTSTETGIDEMSIDPPVSDELSTRVCGGRAGDDPSVPPPGPGPADAALSL